MTVRSLFERNLEDNKLSSILKALKKIEELTPPETFSSLPQPIDAKQALNSKTLKKRRIRKTLILLLLLAAAGTAAGVLFGQRRTIVAKIFPPAGSSNKRSSAADAAQPQRIYKAKISAASEKTARLRPVRAKQPQNSAKSSKSGGSANAFQADQPARPAGAAAAVRDSTTSPLRQQQARVRPKARVAKTPPQPSTAMGVKPVKESIARHDGALVEPDAPAAPKRSPEPAETVYDRVQDSNLKLQALAWSEDDTRRMAVINGRIVHEGESVEGYQVIQIREEDVVVHEGGKSWRLEFGAQR